MLPSGNKARTSNNTPLAFPSGHVMSSSWVISQAFALFNLGRSGFTYEGEHDEDKECKDGAARARDGSEHGARCQEDGEGGQAEGEQLGQEPSRRATHSK